MTATLTALSSAINSAGGVTEAGDATAGTPLADSQVLQGLAKSMKAWSGCPWNPVDYGHCVVAVAKAVWRWIDHWGHSVLDILSLSTFAPPPFDAIGIGAAATNATWYAVQGDYTEAGLSLAAAVPGLAFTKIAKAAKVAATATEGAVSAADAEKAATEAVRVAKVGRWQPGRAPRSSGPRRRRHGRVATVTGHRRRGRSRPQLAGKTFLWRLSRKLQGQGRRSTTPSSRACLERRTPGLFTEARDPLPREPPRHPPRT